jgi:hypothetical protein
MFKNFAACRVVSSSHRIDCSLMVVPTFLRIARPGACAGITSLAFGAPGLHLMHRAALPCDYMRKDCDISSRLTCPVEGNSTI